MRTATGANTWAPSSVKSLLVRAREEGLLDEQPALRWSRPTRRRPTLMRRVIINRRGNADRDGNALMDRNYGCPIIPCFTTQARTKLSSTVNRYWKQGACPIGAIRLAHHKPYFFAP
ncbi:hypothetical protein CHT98_18725 (plasmid) [Azospirillum brasilense]|uniref:Recombinase domain-containing protein n=1 Tax=Azospirillum brasilense TaxID=192 RepID=A0A235HB31_AZOBR|nr:hypothetical protein CHT98_18725 [Azospirillum brasilense]